jgi:hypothetical protein
MGFFVVDIFDRFTIFDVLECLIFFDISIDFKRSVDKVLINWCLVEHFRTTVAYHGST